MVGKKLLKPELSASCKDRVAEAQSFGFNETLWLVATGRVTREALLSEAGFEKVFRTQNWVRVDDFVSCWGKRGAYRLLLELKLASYYFVASGGLIVCC